MAELREGETCRDHIKRPGPGYFTLSAIRDRLHLSTAELRAHLKALGIVLGPFVRDEKYVKKVYKSRKRWLTEEEARRIIERVHALRGRGL